MLLDELRMQHTWGAWSALSKTTVARPGSLIVGISNAGDDSSVVLNSLHAAAVAGRDDSLGYAEWSADPAYDIADPRGWVQSCPGLGHTITEGAIRAALATDPPAVFATEMLCRRVQSMNGAVDMAAWNSCYDSTVTLDALRERVALALDVAADGTHTTLAAAAVTDEGFVNVEVVAAWDSPAAARRDLRTLIERVKPKAFGYFSGGPAAVLGADLKFTNAKEITGSDVTEACQAFAEQVQALAIRHAGDPLLSAHVGAAQKLHQGDGWRFARPRDGGHVDAAYAAAGAVHLARSFDLRPPKKIVVL